ncbi:hypothetical protein ACLOJK_037504, partial [Asimina triloba]
GQFKGVVWTGSMGNGRSTLAASGGQRGDVGVVGGGSRWRQLRASAGGVDGGSNRWRSVWARVADEMGSLDHPILAPAGNDDEADGFVEIDDEMGSK